MKDPKAMSYGELLTLYYTSEGEREKELLAEINRRANPAILARVLGEDMEVIRAFAMGLSCMAQRAGGVIDEAFSWDMYELRVITHAYENVCKVFVKDENGIEVEITLEG